MMQLIKQFAILFLMLFLGDFLSELLHIPIPGNVLGMLFLTVALSTGWMKLEAVEDAAKLLLDHLALFFVPSSVGIMLYFDLIKAQWISILVPTFLSIIIGLYLTAQTVSWMRKRKGGNQDA